MRKRIHKEELLFDVNDTSKIKLGKDLHIPRPDFVNNGMDKIDWSNESLLMAMEIAEDNGDELIIIPDNIMTYSFTFYCKINGQTYHITETSNEEYGDTDYKIELI